MGEEATDGIHHHPLLLRRGVVEEVLHLEVQDQVEAILHLLSFLRWVLEVQEAAEAAEEE